MTAFASGLNAENQKYAKCEEITINKVTNERQSNQNRAPMLQHRQLNDISIQMLMKSEWYWSKRRSSPQAARRPHILCLSPVAFLNSVHASGSPIWFFNVEELKIWPKLYVCSWHQSLASQSLLKWASLTDFMHSGGQTMLFLQFPHFGTDFGSQAFSISTPRVWDSLLPDIRSNIQPLTFRRQLKTHFFTQASGSRKWLRIAPQIRPFSWHCAR